MRFFRMMPTVLVGYCCWDAIGTASAFAPPDTCAGHRPVSPTETDLRRSLQSYHSIPPSPRGSAVSRDRGTVRRTALLLSPDTAWTVASATTHVVAGALATPIVAKNVKGWYRKVDLPSWTPPDRVFAPVWTTLYACMGVAFARVVLRLPAISSVPVWKQPAVALWVIHFALNLSWAPIFFAAKRLRLGLYINYALCITLGFAMRQFAASNIVSGILLVPYAAWLTYATVLNFAICRRNPMVNGYNEAKFQADLLTLRRRAARYAAGA